MPKKTNKELHEIVASHLTEQEQTQLKKVSKRQYGIIEHSETHRLHKEDYFEKLGLSLKDLNPKDKKKIVAKRNAINNPKEVFSVFNDMLALFKNGQERFEDDIYVSYAHLMELPTPDKEHILKKLVINTDIDPKDYKKYAFRLPPEKLDVPAIRILLENNLDRDSRADDIYDDIKIDALTFAKDATAELIFGFSYRDNHRPLHRALHKICNEDAPN
ncbi:MAG TPA: hypothetical protein VHA13_00835, partial [Gammaproteobacteria bacterium]|nr:hypothetical protein [Gammaproteobacteria bacterium]